MGGVGGPDLRNETRLVGDVLQVSLELADSL